MRSTSMRPGIPAQSRTLRPAALGPDGVPQLPRGAADTGIVHQVNLEYLAPVVFRNPSGAVYPDSVVGTDSHTTMINGLGVLGWGVGGIEAEACMLGQPVSMLLPPWWFQIDRPPQGRLHRHRLVLTVVQMLRRRAWWANSWSSTAPAERAEPARSSHRRQHGARVRRHHGLLPSGRETSSSSNSPTATPPW